MIKMTKNDLKKAYLLSFLKSIVNKVVLTALKKKYVYPENHFYIWGKSAIWYVCSNKPNI